MGTETPIDVHCWAFCAAPFFTVVLDWGGTTHADTGLGAGGGWSTTLMPFVTPSYVKFKFQTTCSNGGTATFKWRTEI